MYVRIQLVYLNNINERHGVQLINPLYKIYFKLRRCTGQVIKAEIGCETC